MNPENQREIRRANFFSLKSEHSRQAVSPQSWLVSFRRGPRDRGSNDYLMELNPQQMLAVEEFCQARGWSFDGLVSAAVHSFVEEYGR
jgi:hypothetical protein